MLRVAGIAARTVFFYLAVVAWTGVVGYLLAVPVALVERLLGLRDTHWAQTILYHGVRLCSLPWRLVADVRLDADERVAEGRAVVVCNHHSYVDIFLLLHIYPRIHMTARRTLFRIPFLGLGMALLQHIPHRADRPEQALRRAEGWLRAGRTVGVFPEGTRAPSGSIGTFHSGAFRLAQRTVEQVQPVVVAGTGRVWGKGRLLVHRLGPVAMRVLPPEPVPASLGRKALHARIEDIRKLMEEVHRTLEDEVLPRPEQDPGRPRG